VGGCQIFAVKPALEKPAFLLPYTIFHNPALLILLTSEGLGIILLDIILAIIIIIGIKKVLFDLLHNKNRLLQAINCIPNF